MGERVGRLQAPSWGGGGGVTLILGWERREFAMPHPGGGGEWGGLIPVAKLPWDDGCKHVYLLWELITQTMS
jgi:hypothetical protein